MSAIGSFIDAAVHTRDFRTVGIRVGHCGGVGVYVEINFRPNVSEPTRVATSSSSRRRWTAAWLPRVKS